MFVVTWQGEVPPDSVEWLAAVRHALVDEKGVFRILFQREPGGWRFDVECRLEGGPDEPARKADQNVAFNIYAQLLESGKPLDPNWDPLAVATRDSRVPPANPIDIAVAPVTAIEPPTPADTTVVPPLPDRRGPDEPAAEALEPPPATRSSWWPGLRGPRGRLATLVLVVTAGWLAWGRLRAPETSPPATLSGEALSAQERLKELEAVVARLRNEKEENASRAPARASPLPPKVAAGRERPRAPLDTERKPATPLPVPEPAALGTPALAMAPPAPTEVPTPTPPPPPDVAEETPAPPDVAEESPAPPTPAPVQRGAIVDVNDPEVTRAVLVGQTQPRYPPLALQRGIEGTVVISALVDETGAVVEVSVVRATPRGMGFEETAIRHVKSRRYRPATKGNVPVRVRIEVTIDFRKPSPR
jgi:protein TonB